MASTVAFIPGLSPAEREKLMGFETLETLEATGTHSGSYCNS